MTGQCIILMGVSGTGKTTVGHAIAQQMGLNSSMAMTFTPAEYCQNGGQPAA